MLFVLKVCKIKQLMGVFLCAKKGGQGKRPETEEKNDNFVNSCRCGICRYVHNGGKGQAVPPGGNGNERGRSSASAFRHVHWAQQER